MGVYNYLPEFMDNQDFSGVWILTRVELVAIGGVGLIVFIIASIFTDNVLIKLLIAAIFGGGGGFFLGMKYVGITGYQVLWGAVTFFIKKFVLHSTVYYPSTFPLASTMSQRGDVSEIVDANSSLPTSL